VGRRPLVTLMRALTLAAVVLAITKWWLVPVRVTGRSMEPTYHNGNIRLINRLAYNQRLPQRGDVVSIRKEDQRMILLKRIVALPGEGVQVQEGRVFVNGSPALEPYALGQKVPSMRRAVLLKAGEYFVIGDNRDLSEYGIVQETEIRGKLLF
jgi:signal peptidase I